MPNISYSPKTKRLAVGTRSGQVGIYDLKQGKTQMLNAHSHAVTVLLFSDDGKMLATYAYGDSTLSVWQVCIYMYMHACLRKRKEKKGRVTHQTIAQTNKRICMWRGTPGCPALRTGVVG